MFKNFQFQDMKFNLDKLNEVITAANANEQDKIPAIQQAAAQCTEKGKSIVINSKK